MHPPGRPKGEYGSAQHETAPLCTNVVFDFGAVLFTWRPDLLVAEQLPQHAASEPAARELARAIFHHDDWQSFDRGTVELDAVIARTAQRLALPRQPLARLLSGIGERLTPIADSLALLGRLREQRERHGEVRLYFLSNMPAPFARVLEQRHDFLRWFDGGIFSGDVQMIKPEPAIFALLETRYALDPARTVFIDDLSANVAAAQARGWRGICHRSAVQTERQLFPPPA